jgi:hypothetical protein
VHHRFRLIAVHDLIEPRSIKDVALFERPPFHGPFVAVDKIIIGDRQVTGVAQGFAGMGSDVAGPSGNEYGFFTIDHCDCSWLVAEVCSRRTLVAS